MRLRSVRLRLSFALAAVWTLFGCGGGGGDNPAAPASIEVALSSTAMSLAQGSSSSVMVTVVRTNFTGDVQLSVEHSAAGVTTTLTSATLGAGQTQTTLGVEVGAAAVAGAATLTVRGRAANLSDKTASLALTVTPASSYSLSAPATMSLQPGQSGTTNLALTRIGFTGAVTLSVEGLPSGATGAFSPNPVTADASVLTLSTGTAATGTYTVTVRGTAAGLPDRVVTFALTIAAPSFTIALGTAAASLYQGTTSATLVSLVRTSFSGAVTLTTSGVPAGATVSASPASTTGGTAALTVTTGGAAPGTYTVTVRAAADGMTDRLATYALTIVAAPPSATVVYNLCTPFSPAWVGYQSGSGAWTPLPAASNGDYHFTVAGVGAFAYVLANGGDAATFGYSGAVIYGSAADLNALGVGACTAAAGAKTVTGTVAGVGAGEGAGIAIGRASTTAFGSASGSVPFSIGGIANGPHDLAATRNVTSGSADAASRIILRRALDPPNGAVLPTLDFGGVEAFAPLAHTLTVNGPGSADEIAFVNFITGTETTAFLTFSPVVGGAVTYPGVPDANVSAGDVHSLLVDAQDASAERGMIAYFTLAANRTLTLPPTLSAPSVAVVTTSPSRRLLTLMPYQNAYDVLILTEYSQHGAASAPTDRLLDVVVTSAYYPTPPAQWAALVPDLTGAASYDASWGLASTTTGVFVEVDGGSPLSATRGEGVTITFGATSGTISLSGSTTALASRFAAPRRARSATVQRAPMPRGRPPFTRR